MSSTKSRAVVLLQCTSPDEDWTHLKGLDGVRGATSAEFANCAAALVVKDRNKELKTHLKAFALQPGRVDHGGVLDMARAFAGAGAKRGNIELVETSDGEMPKFDDACEELRRKDYNQIRSFIADARRAKVLKQTTPLQVAVLTYQPEIKEWARQKEEAEALIKSVEEPGPHFLSDFNKDVVLGLRGVHFDVTGGVQQVTLKHVLYESALAYHKTLIFVGKAGKGKSEFGRGLAREFCQRHEKLVYAESGSLDPFGLMTKSGRTKDLGAVFLYDFDLRSKNEQLSREEVKELLYVKESAHFKARYYQAVLPDMVPRIWTINTGKDADGHDDHMRGMARASPLE